MYCGERGAIIKPLRVTEKGDVIAPWSATRCGKMRSAFRDSREICNAESGRGRPRRRRVASQPASTNSAEFDKIANDGGQRRNAGRFRREMKARFPDIRRRRVTAGDPEARPVPTAALHGDCSGLESGPRRRG